MVLRGHEQDGFLLLKGLAFPTLTNCKVQLKAFDPKDD